MTSREEKAVIRAAQYTCRQLSPYGLKAPELARKAVTLAQIRAGRVYDTETEIEALNLALQEAKTIRKIRR